MKEENIVPKFIDRLTGMPIGNRDDSDAGVEGDLELTPSFLRNWTLEEVRQQAIELGKSFEANLEIADRVENDLLQGAQVFFSPEEVDQAVEAKLIPKDLQDVMRDLVSPEGKNDIAIVPSGAVEEWFKQQEIFKLGRSMKMW